jgi:hypothetical protein
MARRRNRIGGQFDAREITLLESPAYRVASRGCRMIMDRLAIEYAHHGGNDNGKLPVTYDQFVEYGLHRHCIAPALREGEALGLFFIAERGRAHAGEFRSPHLFRIPYRQVSSDPPTNEWKRIKTIEDAHAIARAARKPIAKTEGGKSMRIPKQKSKRALSNLNRDVIKDQRLCKSFYVKRTGTVETSYLLEPSGRRVTPKEAEDAIKAGLLVPANDGLFGTSQTWVPK